MSGGLEREFKLRLPSAAAALALRCELGGPAAEPSLQINHFFDTPARDLGRARIGLRLREEGGAASLTLKGPGPSDGGALASRPEEELALDPGTARALLAGERSPLAVLAASALGTSALVRRARELVGNAGALVRLGAFENERVRVGPLRFPPGSAGPPLVFEFDRTTFPGEQVEHELELELPEGADADEIERALAALLARVAVPLEPAPSKAVRFLRALADAERR